jgi:hypothetical protein
VKHRIVLLLVLALLAPFVLVSPISAADNPAIAPAVKWLTTQQQADGSFLGFSGKADPGTTADVALALSAAGTDPATVAHGGPSIIDYLRSTAGEYGMTVAGAAKLTLAAVAAGDDPRDFGGQNLVQAMLTKLDRQTGLFDPQLYVHADTILALAAAGQTIPAAAITALDQHQADNGGWAFTGETGDGKADSNTTAIAIQALVASGHGDSPVIPKAQDYLSGLQDDSGLFAYQPANGATLLGDANSTALVIQALLASGQSLDSDAVAKAVKALEGMQNDSGAFYYQQGATDDNVLATIQALPALAGKPLPVWPLHAPGRTLDQAKSAAQAGDARLCVFFTETKHNACNGFLAYFNAFGGVDAFGYPLTEEFTSIDPATGRPTTMQYFQRARFEWHPGSTPQRFDVQLGLLGAEQLTQP